MKTPKIKLRCWTSPSVIVVLLLVFTSAAHADYKSTVLSDHPVGYWPLNLNVETNGSAADFSGHGNPGAYVNIDPIANNVPGPSAFITNGISFDGTFTYVNLGAGSNTALLNFAGQITMEAWVNPPNITQYADLIGKGYDNAVQYELEMRQNGSIWHGGAYDNTGGTNGVQDRGPYGGLVTASAWTYVVCTWDGTNWNLYQDGLLQATNVDPYGALYFSNSVPWAIGGGGQLSGTPSGLFAGDLSQVALYTNALTPAQVVNHYLAGKYGVPPTSPPVIAVQPLSHKVYTNAAATFSVVPDAVTGPFGYQWYKGVSSISGQTNASLTLTNVQAGDATSYKVVITNLYGSTTSAVVTLTLVAPASTYDALIGRDQPLAFYPLDETLGTQAYDYAGGYDGKYMNSPLLGVAGPSAYIPTGVGFNGSSQAVPLSIPNDHSISGPITMEAWVLAANTSQSGDVIGKGYDGVNDELALKASGGNWWGGRYSGIAGNVYAIGGTVSTAWTHVVASCDGTNWMLYVNGSLATLGPADTGAASFAAPWAIADGTIQGAANYFNGDLSEVALYTRALSSAQVVAHYLTGAYGSTNVGPIIATEPHSTTRYVGGTATFTVVPGPSASPLGYLWYKGSNLLIGQTNASLILTNVQSLNATNYSVIINNSSGSVTSSVVTLTVVVPASSYDALVFGDQPLAFYPLDESSGATAYDYVGGYDGTYQNTPTLGVVGPSAYIARGVGFDGFSQAVPLSIPNDFNIGRQLTLEAWVQPNLSSTFGDIFAKGPDGYSGNYYEIKLRESGGGYVIGTYDNSASPQEPGASGGTVTGDWTHLVGTYDASSNWNLYVNGVLVNSQAGAEGVINFKDPWAIADGTDVNGVGRWFAGNVSKAAIYTHALTPEQVVQHYFMGLNGTISSVPPSIAIQPHSESVYTGASPSFTVVPNPNAQLSYQWYKGPSVISGQTSGTLTLANAQAGDVGSYSVVISNASGVVTSSVVTLTLVPPSFYGANVFQDGAVAFYPLDETTGTTAVDYVGGNNGVYSNFTSLASIAGPSSFLPRGIAFDGSINNGGSDQFVNIGKPPGLNISGEITLESWVQLPASASSANPALIVGHVANGINGQVTLGTSGTNSNYEVSRWPGPGVFVDSSATNDWGGGWVHVVGSYDGTSWNLYRNGELVSSSNSVASALSLSGNWGIAGVDTSPSIGFGLQRLNANISGVAIYNYALTPGQVFSHYSAGVSGTTNFSLRITHSGGHVTVSWPTWPAGILQQANKVTGPYTDVAAASSPYITPVTNAAAFYRLRN